MEPVLKTAISGTSRGTAGPPEETSTDRLFARVQYTSPERRLLLRAGAGAVYAAGGHRTTTLRTEPPEAAPEETLPACSAEAAEMLRPLLQKKNPVLIEALERLRRAGLRLPHGLVLVALDTSWEDARAALSPVLGERGRWLARFRPDWGWASEEASDEDPEIIWDEGTIKERVSALRRMRRENPATGRERVEDVWRAEKAEARVAMLEAFEVGLSLDDETFLESVLRDRSSRVRAVAASRLATLPQSAYARRNVARADGFLDRERGGRLVVQPPEIDEGWRNELPAEKSPPWRMGEKAWDMIRTLEVVPPTHWETRFGATPEELVSSATGEWEMELLIGWGRAAERHGAEAWAMPLWKRLYEGHQRRDRYNEWELAWEAVLSLAPMLPQEELAAEFARLLGRTGMTREMSSTLNRIPGPWDDGLGRTYLEGLRRYVTRIFAELREENDDWNWSLLAAAERIPPSCFELATFTLPDVIWVEEEFENGQVFLYERPYLKRWREWLATFEETVDLRRRLIKEIPL